jgi:hypothetical protein
VPNVIQILSMPVCDSFVRWSRAGHGAPGRRAIGPSPKPNHRAVRADHVAKRSWPPRSSNRPRAAPRAAPPATRSCSARLRARFPSQLAEEPRACSGTRRRPEQHHQAVAFGLGACGRWLSRCPVSGKLSPRPGAWGRGFDHHVGARTRRDRGVQRDVQEEDGPAHAWAQGEELPNWAKVNVHQVTLAVEARGVYSGVWPPSSPVTPRPSARTLQDKIRLVLAAGSDTAEDWARDCVAGIHEAELTQWREATAALDENKTGGGSDRAKVQKPAYPAPSETQAQGQGPCRGLRRCSCSKKSPLDLGGGRRHDDGDERALIVSLDGAGRGGLAKNEPARWHQAADGAARAGARRERWRRQATGAEDEAQERPFRGGGELESWRRRRWRTAT